MCVLAGSLLGFIVAALHEVDRFLTRIARGLLDD